MENKTIHELKRELIKTLKIENNEEEIEILKNNRKKQIKVIKEILDHFKAN